MSQGTRQARDAKANLANLDSLEGSGQRSQQFERSSQQSGSGQQSQQPGQFSQSEQPSQERLKGGLGDTTQRAPAGQRTQEGKNVENGSRLGNSD
jgi:hypothetical protein